jgi:anti-anti-sigma factor
MSEPQLTYLTSALEDGVLMLTITHQQIEGEEVAHRLKEELLAIVDYTGASRVAIDMSQTRYLSSIAFWPLLALRRRLADVQGKLLLCGLTGAILDVFTTTKMVSATGPFDAPFEMAPDRAAALERLRTS